LSRLKTGDKEIVESRFQKKISELMDTDLKNFIKKVMVLLGWPMRNLPQAEEEKQFLIQGLRVELKRWSEQDVLLALRKALKKEISYDLKLYDQTISLAFFMGLMTEYYEYTKPVMTKYYESQNKLQEPSKEEKKKKSINVLVNSFKSHKQGDYKQKIGLYRALYTTLYDLKIYETPEQDRERIKQEVEKELLEENIRKVTTNIPMHERRVLKDTISRMKEGNTPGDVKAKIKTISMARAVDEYFTELKDMQCDLEDYLPE
jgi:hypothetical protein